MSTGLPSNETDAVYTPGVYVTVLFVVVLVTTDVLVWLRLVLSMLFLSESAVILAVLVDFGALSVLGTAESFFWNKDIIKAMAAMRAATKITAPSTNSFIWITTIFVFEFIYTYTSFFVIIYVCGCVAGYAYIYYFLWKGKVLHMYVCYDMVSKYIATSYE